MEPKIGVYICHCGSNIAGTVDVEKVSEYAKTLPAVAVSRDYKFMCSDPGQDLIKKILKSWASTAWWSPRVLLKCTSPPSAGPCRTPV